MERSTIFAGKPSISIRAIYTMAMLVITRGYIIIYRISHCIPLYIYTFYPIIFTLYIYIYITYSNVSLAQMLPLIPQNAGSQHLQGWLLGSPADLPRSPAFRTFEKARKATKGNRGKSPEPIHLWGCMFLSIDIYDHICIDRYLFNLIYMYNHVFFMVVKPKS